ncbi:GatB/YqeY domain-containing protein [Oceanidesulfovibrio marinus]|uniref:GatB/YqeY domain-containing protein n=1 Tax=Oceanidesulfovibrio marinus TaxID=370038 RepID=A0A6P1ZIC7_9BACT|nr:GatB/YqeY domain-containing protein [Oceanidesulfovibrio marinus]TVM35102.1 GatB/YqeY domain-containing protein [Oceanidesulfovibrio marinus]
MSLLSRIEQDFLTAYKAKEEVRVRVLRALKTAAKNKHVELGREPNDDEVIAILGKEAKQRHESVDQFTKGGREDLADKEREELEILSEYLPQQLSPEETEAAVDEAIQKTGASSMKDMGGVMQEVMASHKGRIDGKVVSEIVRRRLAG